MKVLTLFRPKPTSLKARTWLPTPHSVAVSVFGLGIVLWSLLNIGHWLASPQDTPQRADVVVALGGGNKERLWKAVELYKQGYAKQILLTGFHHDGGDHQPADHYRHWQVRLLLEWGALPEALLFDGQSRNSYEEANNVAKLMKERRWKVALVVSDPPHLRRLAMVWKKVAAQYGIEYRLIATEPPSWDASRWWRENVWAKFVGMELVKLAYYMVAY